MNIKMSLLFLALAAAVTVGVFNYSSIVSNFENKSENEEGVFKKKDLTKIEVFDFFKSQSWFNYSSKPQAFDLSSIAPAKMIYIHIWASWCGPCLNEIPELLAYAKENKDKAQFILISLDESQIELEKFLKSFPEMNEAHFIKVWDYDKKISKKLDVDRLPMTIILKPASDTIRNVRSVVNWKNI